MQSQSQPSREKKRKQFASDAQAKSKSVPIMIAVLVILAGVAVYLVVKSSSDAPEATAVTSTNAGTDEKRNASASPAPGSATADSRQAVEPQGSVVKIPLADLGGEAKFFKYSLNDGKVIRFFAIKSADGLYRAALDACDVCYHAKKGYRQEGDKMICNKCNLPFEVSRIGDVSGRCNPVGLPRSIEGDQLVIKASDLASRAGYF